MDVRRLILAVVKKNLPITNYNFDADLFKGRCNPLLNDFVASSQPNHLSLLHEARTRRKGGVLSWFSIFVVSTETSRDMFLRHLHPTGFRHPAHSSSLFFERNMICRLSMKSSHDAESRGVGAASWFFSGSLFMSEAKICPSSKGTSTTQRPNIENRSNWKSRRGSI